nr:MAG TPA: hypothetical protein [Caudoviricetes sp.]
MFSFNRKGRVLIKVNTENAHCRAIEALYSSMKGIGYTLAYLKA